MKFYITTSIAYTNASPHIGFAQEVLAADVLARYHRQIGDDVFFLTGTDEHGIKIQKAATEANLNPKDFTDKLAREFAELKSLLNLTNDDFIRTTQNRHIKIVTKLWNACLKNGDIYKKEYEAWYCPGCEAFIASKESKQIICPTHPSLKPEKVKEENYFFALSKYQKEIEKLFEKNPNFVQPKNRYNEILNFIKSGLQDISVSRPRKKLYWGIPVPNDNTQTIYVWFDALANYLYPQKYWPADLHIIGKDILRFHAALWPAMLMSAKIELPKRIFVHGFISVEGQKMSKSLGNVISPTEVVKKFGTEATRYLLLRELNFAEDSDFSWKKFINRYNADLANDLGNLVQRVIVMAKKYNIKFKIQNSKPEINQLSMTTQQKTAILKAIEELRFIDALSDIWQLISSANQYIDAEKPWELAKEDREKLEDVIFDLLNTLYQISELITPFMPETAKKIKNQIETLKPEPLFPRV